MDETSGGYNFGLVGIGLLWVAIFAVAIWWSERDPDRHQRGEGSRTEDSRARGNDIRWTGHHSN